MHTTAWVRAGARGSRVRGFVLAVLLLASWSARAGAMLGLPAPDRSWTLQLPDTGWILNRSSSRPDGGQNYFLYANEDRKTFFSVYTEAARKCATAAACADMLTALHGPGRDGATAIERSERNGFVIVKWVLPVPEAGKNEYNYSVETVHKGYWVDLHLSRFPAATDDSDAAALNALVDAATFVDGVAADIATPPVALGHGSFDLDATHHVGFTGPVNWAVSAKTLSDPAAVKLRVQPDYSKSFMLMVTAFQQPKAMTEEENRQHLQEGLSKATAKANESAVSPAVVHDLPIKNGLQMRYFEVEDKTWKEGSSGFRFMLQGAAASSDMMVTFTLFTNDPKLPEKQAVLDMMQSASYE